MAVKIRLRAQGSVNRAMYRVVATDSRAPRDGKYIETLGWYKPRAKPELQVELKPDRLQYWLDLGAVFTDKVEFLMKKAAPGVFQNLRAKEQAKRLKSTTMRSKSAAVASSKKAAAKPAAPKAAKAKPAAAKK